MLSSIPTVTSRFIERKWTVEVDSNSNGGQAKHQKRISIVIFAVSCCSHTHSVNNQLQFIMSNAGGAKISADQLRARYIGTGKLLLKKEWSFWVCWCSTLLLFTHQVTPTCPSSELHHILDRFQISALHLTPCTTAISLRISIVIRWQVTWVTTISSHIMLSPRMNLLVVYEVKCWRKWCSHVDRKLGDKNLLRT